MLLYALQGHSMIEGPMFKIDTILSDFHPNLNTTAFTDIIKVWMIANDIWFVKNPIEVIASRLKALQVMFSQFVLNPL